MVNMVNDFFARNKQTKNKTNEKTHKFYVVQKSNFVQIHQVIVIIFIKELQMVYLTFIVNVSNGNMEEFERKI